MNAASKKGLQHRPDGSSITLHRPRNPGKGPLPAQLKHILFSLNRDKLLVS